MEGCCVHTNRLHCRNVCHNCRSLTDVVTTYILNVIGPHSFNQPVGFLRHPANLSLSWFVGFVLLQGFGIAELSILSSSVALIAGLIAVAFAFVVTWRLDDDCDWRGFSLWILTVSILSPIMWGQFMVCVVIVFWALAKGFAGRRAVIAAVASYLVLVVLGDLHGYPLNLVPKLAQSYFAGNICILHLLPESVTVSLILLYLACCWFVLDNRCAVGEVSRSHNALIESDGRKLRRAKISLVSD